MRINFSNKTTNSQIGDTIIEVMIAIMVIGGVLAATFAISNRAQKGALLNNERYQAQMLANQQAERIKLYSATVQGRANLYGLAADTTICFTSSSAYISGSCSNIDDKYTITVTPKKHSKYITNDPPGDVTNTFYIKVVWDSLISNASADGKENVEIVYGI